MKNVFLILMSCCVMTAASAQTQERYTVSGGLLGAVNLSKFRTTDDDIPNSNYETKTGWSAGAWVNFPIGRAVSLEPQVMYSSYRYLSNTPNPLLLINDGRISYISVPVALKLHAGNNFAITLGPQFDFVSDVEDNDGVIDNNDVKKTSISAFGGFELFPRSRVSIFGRYIHGFNDMDNRGSEANAIEYKNQNIQAGLKLKLFGKKIPADSDGDGVADNVDECPTVAGVARYKGCPIPDSDGDGINDELDRCPNQAGTAKYNGCPIPDTDGDGINDELDKCPNQAGTAKYEGCPVPDTDGDGINDEQDRCPNEKGTAERQGCPFSDRDNDGIADEEDRCIDLAGSAANKGCPDVPANVSKSLGTAGAGITFGTTNATLTTKSNASLNNIVKLMNENPGLRIRVEAHTDNAGDDDRNMQLTQDRANAVKAYLVGKGIAEDRITAEGLGESQPIADNGTSAGRTKNRRIEIKVDY